jgi:SOS-response transcriptional repressor LexA
MEAKKLLSLYKISQAQQRVVQCIQDSYSKKGTSLSQVQMTKILKFRSQSSVAEHINNLVIKDILFKNKSIVFLNMEHPINSSISFSPNLCSKQKPLLSPKQLDVFNFVKNSIVNLFLCPTNIEIAEYFSFKSANASFCHLKAIEKKGYISMASKKGRNVSLVLDANINH